MVRQIGEIDPEHLPGVYQELVEVVGLEAALKLAKYFGGTYQYFPKYDRIAMGLRNERIRAEFDGRNYQELARRYGLSTRHVRDIVRPAHLAGKRFCETAQETPGPDLL